MYSASRPNTGRIWKLWRMLPPLEGINCIERENKLGLFSLEPQMLRGDLIQVFGIVEA